MRTLKGWIILSVPLTLAHESLCEAVEGSPACSQSEILILIAEIADSWKMSPHVTASSATAT